MPTWLKNILFICHRDLLIQSGSSDFLDWVHEENQESATNRKDALLAWLKSPRSVCDNRGFGGGERSWYSGADKSLWGPKSECCEDPWKTSSKHTFLRVVTFDDVHGRTALKEKKKSQSHHKLLGNESREPTASERPYKSEEGWPCRAHLLCYISCFEEELIKIK